MKRFTKMIYVLLGIWLCAAFSSCDFLNDYRNGSGSGLGGNSSGNGGGSSGGGSEDKFSSDAVWEFKLTDKKGSYYYFSGQDTFDYNYNGEYHEDCIYQISFTATKSDWSAGKWTLYTRPKASSTPIETVDSGTFTGVIIADGQVTLVGENNASKTVTITNSGTETDGTGGTFSWNVYTINQKIGASAPEK